MRAASAPKSLVDSSTPNFFDESTASSASSSAIPAAAASAASSSDPVVDEHSLILPQDQRDLRSARPAPLIEDDDVFLYSRSLDMNELLRPFQPEDFLDKIPLQFESIDDYAASFRPMLKESVRSSAYGRLRSVALADSDEQSTCPWVSARVARYRDSQKRYLLECPIEDVARAQAEWRPSTLVVLIERFERPSLMSCLRGLFLSQRGADRRDAAAIQGFVANFPRHFFGVILGEKRKPAVSVKSSNPSFGDPGEGDGAAFEAFIELFQGAEAFDILESLDLEVLSIADLITDIRADKALARLLQRCNAYGLHHHLLQPQPDSSLSSSSSDADAFDSKSVIVVDQMVDRFCGTLNLNPSQIRTLCSTLQPIQSRWLHLIQGPPGSPGFSLSFSLLIYCFSTLLLFHFSSQAPEKPP